MDQLLGIGGPSHNEYQALADHLAQNETYSTTQDILVGKWNGTNLYRRIIVDTGTGSRNFSIGSNIAQVVSSQCISAYTTYVSQPYYQSASDGWNYYLQNGICYYRATGAAATNQSTVTLILLITKS